MKILELDRLDNQNVLCKFEHEGRTYTITVQAVVDGTVKGLYLKDLPHDERLRLYSAPEGLDFTRQLWRFIGGENLQLPMELSMFVKG